MARLATSWSLNPVHDQFHVPASYFLSHSVGCLPKSTRRALKTQFFGPWKSGTNWAEWMPLLDQFRSGIGALLGVPKATICPQINVSSALTKILYALPREEGRSEIVLTRQDFPTIGFVFKQAERMGYRIRFVDGDPCQIENWNEALSEKTAIVHVTHVFSNDSRQLPVHSICAQTRNVGAVSVVDIAQALIAVPTPVSEWQPDFVTGTGVKYLCAGPGACFLYASESRLREAQPIDVGWFSHENPFEMDIEQFRYASDAMRFFGGTPSPAPLVCALSALNVWRQIDLAAMQDQIQTSLNTLTDCVAETVQISPRHTSQRGAMFVVAPSNTDGLASVLKQENIDFDERATGFRFSLHGYTSETDIEKLGDILRQYAQ